MDTVTYPDPAVRALLDKSFACFQLDLMQRHPDFKEASAGRKVVWSPTFIWSDAKRQEIRRLTGWLAPRNFLAELRFVIAMSDFQGTRFREAAAGFAAILAEFPKLEIAPETLYWQGIAGFLAGNRDHDALGAAWTKLHETHPETRWGMHAAVIEDYRK